MSDKEGESNHPGTNQHNEVEQSNQKDSLDNEKHRMTPTQERTDKQNEAKFEATPEYMQTMPQPHDENNLRGSPNSFHPNTTGGPFFQRKRDDQLSTGRDYGMQKYARFASNWDDRFHITASQNNKKSYTYYKQFFGKPSRSNERIALKPKKQLDPYMENENKTRFPRYSKIYGDRSVDKELGWVDNFAVTCSKNNTKVHNTYKEYFDKPVQYGGLVTVAASKGVPDATVTSKISMHKPTATMHVLKEDRANKYHIKRVVLKSIEHRGMIPFLRDHETKFNAYKRHKRERVKSYAQKRLSKEYGWHQVGYPISMHNERSHFSKKLKFEDL